MRVIIIGSGIGGVTFAEKLRALSPDVQITLLTKETDGYYSRPMLSHGFSKAGIEESIILKPFNKLLENNICVISGVEVTGIDREAQTVAVSGTDDLETLAYDRLVLALGSGAFIPPPFLPFRDLFFLFNSLQDLKKLLQFRQDLLNQRQHPHWAIIGGGLIGCEVASDLAVSGDQVTLFHAMDRLMERQLVEEDSATLLDVLQKSSVKILLEQNVEGFSASSPKVIVNTPVSADEFDAIIVSCGFKPRTALASAAKLNTGRGIKVNAYLQTNDENIYALGDVAELPNGKLYAFILPIRHQALWLANFFSGKQQQAWTPPTFKAKAKVHGFEAANPYIF
jgi:NAD(P)H-nitrite reductase large subunit